MVHFAASMFHGGWSNHEDLVTYSEEMGLTKSMLDASSPNDDMWKKFLTPPNSPRSIGESSESEESSSDSLDSCERLQNVCDHLDSSFEVNTSRCTSSSNLRSKLISDCMWSGNHHRGNELPKLVKGSNIVACTRKLSLALEDDTLYPTPCPSPPPSVTNADVPDCPTSSECVDPTTVFPFSITMDVFTCQSDTDEEIDVVTVETKPHPVAGTKRKISCTTPLVFGKIETSSILQRSKSVPQCKFRTDRHIVRKTTIYADDMDPTARRATHNVLERKRRIDLKNSFERLRECVPNLEQDERAPKVVVLKKASLHIMSLMREERRLNELKRQLQSERQDLLSRIKILLS